MLQLTIIVLRQFTREAHGLITGVDFAFEFRWAYIRGGLYPGVAYIRDFMVSKENKEENNEP